MDIYLAKTQGFCAGVSYAINIVDKALARYGPPLYVYHDIVHNTYVVHDFKQRGVIFVEDIADVPPGSRIIFSAHGVSPQVVADAAQRNLRCIDASCPLVKKVHREASTFSARGCEVVLIGHKGHQEITGTAGYVNPDRLHIIENEKDVDHLDIPSGAPVAYITQTTLSVDETKDIVARLRDRFPPLEGPPSSDLCYATQNRQDAVKELARFCDRIIICGSPNSSNSNRLRETGLREGVDTQIVDNAAQLDMNALVPINKVGISSGASVPTLIVDELIDKIKQAYPRAEVHTFDNPEKDIVFKLPEI